MNRNGKIEKMHVQMQRLYKATKVLCGAETPTALAKILNVSPQVINNWEARGISDPGLLKSQKIIGCNAIWVKEGIGEMSIGESQTINQAAGRSVPHGYIRLPLLDAPHGMGENLVEVQNPEITRYIDVLESWARMQLGTINPRGIQIVPALGDSMKGTIEDGSIVFVDTNVRAYEGDGLYAIVWDGRIQIKRLQAKHKEQKLLIKSDNARYEIDEADDTLIISGRVRAWWNLSRP